MNAEIMTKAEKIVAAASRHTAPENSEPYCVLALIDDEGYPTASTITPSRAEGLRRLTFCTGLESDKAKRIMKCGRAAVCFNSAAHNVTLVGTIEVVTAPEVKKEMWYDDLSFHFSGPEDPGYCVLRFTARRYNLFVDWQEIKGEF